MHFADRLALACRTKKTSLCVGIDPRWDALPAEIRTRHASAPADGFTAFALRVLDIVAPFVGVVKPQSAFFEALGPEGMFAQKRVLKRARELGLVTILDNKRNDIASTAQAYADACFHPDVWHADALTINPYLGRDAVEPFLQSARRHEGGVFVLVRTSNAGAGQFQDLVCDGKPIYQHVGEAVGAWAQEHLGACGLGDVGSVVGATHPAELAQIRGWIPHVNFLIPGYGAQGGSADDTRAGYRSDGLGAIVNSSRGIIACFKPDDPRWEARIEEATRKAIAELPCVE